MSTIIYNHKGKGIEINPNPNLKIQFITKTKNIWNLPPLINFANLENEKFIEEVEFQKNYINISSSKLLIDMSRVNGIYLPFSRLENENIVDIKKDILDFLNIDIDLLKKAEILCDYLKIDEVVIERNYNIYFLKRVHSSLNIESGWLFNGKPNDKIYTKVNISIDWIDRLDKLFKDIYFDISEVLPSEDPNKLLVPVILEPRGIGIRSSNLEFCMSKVNGNICQQNLMVEAIINNKFPINLTNIFLSYYETNTNYEFNGK